MTRTHVHFAAGLPLGMDLLPENQSEAAASVSSAPADATPVISGMRSSSSILIYINLPAAMQDGLAFFKSDNGVLLCAGDESSLIPVKYFRRVEERKDGLGVLVRDGVVVKEAPKTWSKADRGAGNAK
jgi:2'-phosphotransferase